MEPELNARNRQDVAKVAECRADPRRKGSVELFPRRPALGFVSAPGQQARCGPCGAGALVLDAERKVHELFGEKQEGIAE